MSGRRTAWSTFSTSTSAHNSDVSRRLRPRLDGCAGARDSASSRFVETPVLLVDDGRHDRARASGRVPPGGCAEAAEASDHYDVAARGAAAVLPHRRAFHALVAFGLNAPVTSRHDPERAYDREQAARHRPLDAPRSRRSAPRRSRCIGEESDGIHVSQSVGGDRAHRRDARPRRGVSPRAVVRRRDGDRGAHPLAGWTVVHDTQLTAAGPIARLLPDHARPAAAPVTRPAPPGRFVAAGPRGRSRRPTPTRPSSTTPDGCAPTSPSRSTSPRARGPRRSSSSMYFPAGREVPNGKPPAGWSEGTGGDVSGRSPSSARRSEGLEVLDPSPGSPVLAYDLADRDGLVRHESGVRDRGPRCGARRAPRSAFPPGAREVAHSCPVRLDRALIRIAFLAVLRRLPGLQRRPTLARGVGADSVQKSHSPAGAGRRPGAARAWAFELRRVEPMLIRRHLDAAARSAALLILGSVVAVACDGAGPSTAEGLGTSVEPSTGSLETPQQSTANDSGPPPERTGRADPTARPLLATHPRRATRLPESDASTGNDASGSYTESPPQTCAMHIHRTNSHDGGGCGPGKCGSSFTSWIGPTSPCRSRTAQNNSDPVLQNPAVYPTVMCRAPTATWTVGLRGRPSRGQPVHVGDARLCHPGIAGAHVQHGVGAGRHRSLAAHVPVRGQRLPAHGPRAARGPGTSAGRTRTARCTRKRSALSSSTSPATVDHSHRPPSAGPLFDLSGDGKSRSTIRGRYGAPARKASSFSPTTGTATGSSTTSKSSSETTPPVPTERRRRTASRL